MGGSGDVVVLLPPLPPLVDEDGEDDEDVIVLKPLGCSAAASAATAASNSSSLLTGIPSVPITSPPPPPLPPPPLAAAAAAVAAAVPVRNSEAESSACRMASATPVTEDGAPRPGKVRKLKPRSPAETSYGRGRGRAGPGGPLPFPAAPAALALPILEDDGEDVADEAGTGGGGGWRPHIDRFLACLRRSRTEASCHRVMSLKGVKTVSRLGTGQIETARVLRYLIASSVVDTACGVLETVESLYGKGDPRTAACASAYSASGAEEMDAYRDESPKRRWSEGRMGTGCPSVVKIHCDGVRCEEEGDEEADDEKREERDEEEGEGGVEEVVGIGGDVEWSGEASSNNKNKYLLVSDRKNEDM